MICVVPSKPYRPTYVYVVFDQEKVFQGCVRPNMLDESEERHGMPQAACTTLVPERGNDLMQGEDSFSKGAVTSCTNNFCRGYLTADSTCNLNDLYTMGDKR